MLSVSSALFFVVVLFGIVTVFVKPVLNWANVCLLNILRTVRRTVIRFLIELLVR